jgi:hypothetical protein
MPKPARADPKLTKVLNISKRPKSAGSVNNLVITGKRSKGIILFKTLISP